MGRESVPVMNQDLFNLFLSKDKDREPARVINITPDVYSCVICPDWLGTEADTLEHEIMHPQEHCTFCNRAIYILGSFPEDTPINLEKNHAFVCSVCSRNALEFKKTYRYKWKLFKYYFRKLFKND
jgi:hypothetical protein